MKIESNENQTILKEVYNSIILETKEGKQLYVCMRDWGFEMKIDDGEWHLLTTESDFKQVSETESGEIDVSRASEFEIKKKEYFRSNPETNMSDDMVRLTIDCKRKHIGLLEKLVRTIYNLQHGDFKWI